MNNMHQKSSKDSQHLPLVTVLLNGYYQWQNVTPIYKPHTLCYYSQSTAPQDNFQALHFRKLIRFLLGKSGSLPSNVLWEDTLDPKYTFEF